jgi:hypothetical protein
MSSFISSTQATTLETQIQNHFDTFKRNIVVYKSPIKTITTVSNDPILGYDNDSIEEVITTTPVSGVYPAMIQFTKKQKTLSILDTHASAAKGEVLIKVEEDCKEFIKNGKTEAILVDGITYNVISDEAISKFLGLTYYIYGLERTS